MKAHHENSVDYFLQSLGHIYEAGACIHVERLYPKVIYPVPRGTPMISPLIKWDFSLDWPVISDKDTGHGAGTVATVMIDPFSTDEFNVIFT